MKSFKFLKKIPMGFIVVIFLAIIPLLDLFHTGLPLTHDGMDHVARIANFYNSLSDGILFPRWAKNLNWGYGHPILMFLYPLPSYFASLFHLLGFSLVVSVKMVFGLGFIASGITMFLWVRNQFNEYAAVAAAILYLYSPYRFIDLYVRGAIGEHVAFIFPPLILYFILKFFKENDKSKEYYYFLGICISFASLLLSHNAISLMFIPFIFIYAVLLSFALKQKIKLIYAFAALFSGFLLSSFFTLPAFFEGKFTLRDIVTGGEYKSRFVNLLSLINGSWNYGISGAFSVQLGIVNLISLILLPLTFLRLKKNVLITRILLIAFISFAISIFLMIQQSDFLYKTFTILQKFQFPWRFLSLSIFALSVFGAGFVFSLKNNTYKKIVISIIIVLVLFTTSSFWKAKGFSMKPESYYNNVYYGTTDTGESAPIWSVRFMEKEPKAHMEVFDGKALISELSRNSVKHSYKISVLSDKALIKDNTLYFPSWTVFANEKKVPIQFQNPNQRGLITFELNKGEYRVDVVFKDTKLRMISNTITLVVVFILVILGVVFKKNK